MSRISYISIGYENPFLFIGKKVPSLFNNTIKSNNYSYIYSLLGSNSPQIGAWESIKSIEDTPRLVTGRFIYFIQFPK